MFTCRSTSSTTRYRSIRLSPIVEYSRLQPPVGVSAVLSPIGEGHPLRSPMRHSLGEPLPHQLADTWQAAPEAPELYPDTNFDIVSLAPHPSQSLYEISMRTRRKFQLLDRLRRYAKVGVRVYLGFPRLSTSYTKLRGTFLPVTTSSAGCLAAPVTCMPYPYRQRSP